MADHVKTLSERVNVFGVAPSTKWDAFNWGEANWGEGTLGVTKDVEKFLDSDLVLSSDNHSNEIDKIIEDSNFVLMAMTDTKLTDSNGYSYVFPGGTTDAEDQTRSDWTESSAGGSIWTSGSVGTNPWSET